MVKKGVTPNKITIFACVLCTVYSALLWSSFDRASFLASYLTVFLLLLPVLQFIRMALNALDGMVAKATANITPQGSVLNEVCDVVADAALFAALLIMFADGKWWCLLAFLSLLTEFLSLAVYQAKGVRPHSGPFGKSDRAVYFGLLAMLLVANPLPETNQPFWLSAYVFIGIALAIITLWNRWQFTVATE